MRPLVLESPLGDGTARDGTSRALSDLGVSWVLLSIATAGQKVGRRRQNIHTTTSE